jgi:hypothetical protein
MIFMKVIWSGLRGKGAMEERVHIGELISALVYLYGSARRLWIRPAGSSNDV